MVISPNEKDTLQIAVLLPWQANSGKIDSWVLNSDVRSDLCIAY